MLPRLLEVGSRVSTLEGTVMLTSPMRLALSVTLKTWVPDVRVTSWLGIRNDATRLPLDNHQAQTRFNFDKQIELKNNYRETVTSKIPTIQLDEVRRVFKNFFNKK